MQWALQREHCTGEMNKGCGVLDEGVRTFLIQFPAADLNVKRWGRETERSAHTCAYVQILARSSCVFS